MNYYTVQPGFHPQIIARTKQSTIRGKAKVKPGETFALRYWSGKPYGKGTTMPVLGTATCLSIYDVEIGNCGYSGFRLSHIAGNDIIPKHIAPEDFSRMEGFDSDLGLRVWFAENHDVPRKSFRGVLTYWGGTFQQNNKEQS